MRGTTRRAGAGAARPRRRARRCRAPRPQITGARPATAADGELHPAAGNGATAGELAYEYSLNGGGWAALPGQRRDHRPQQRHDVHGRRCGHRARRRALRRSPSAPSRPRGPVRAAVGTHRERDEPRAEHRAQLGLHRRRNGRADHPDADQHRRRRLAERREPDGSRTVGNGYSRPTASRCARRMPRASGRVARRRPRTDDPPATAACGSRRATARRQLRQRMPPYVVTVSNLELRQPAGRACYSCERRTRFADARRHGQLPGQRHRPARLLRRRRDDQASGSTSRAGATPSTPEAIWPRP